MKAIWTNSKSRGGKCFQVYNQYRGGMEPCQKAFLNREQAEALVDTLQAELAKGAPEGQDRVISFAVVGREVKGEAKLLIDNWSSFTVNMVK